MIKDFINTALAAFIFTVGACTSLAEAFIAWSWGRDLYCGWWLIVLIIDLYVCYVHFSKRS